ncbi:MAG: hypothetical protein WBH75_02685 [Thermoanaerobaculia bacterium]
MKRVLIYTTTAAVVLIVTASMAIAGEVGGNNFAVAKPVTSTELPNGMTYATTGNSNVCTTTDPNHPLNQASGDCDGACIIDANDNATCMGSCTWVDKDGHLAFFTWTGQNEGNWRLVGGSGKYAHATGRGTWEGTGLYAGGILRNTWSGEIDIK